MKPKFGLYVPQSLPINTIIRWVEIAEECGYDSVWTYDHLLPYDGSPLNSPILESWTLTTYMAAITKRIRLGILVLCNNFRHPPLLAKMTATLDQLSRGRFNLGIGAGWYSLEHKSYGFSFPNVNERMDRLEESILIIKAMLSDAIPIFKGKYYKISNAYNYPQPIQKPHPPIWVGGRHPRILDLAAKHANVWNLAFYTGNNPESFGALSHELDNLCKKYGRDPESLIRSWHGLVMLGKDSEAFKEMKKKFSLKEFEKRSVIEGTPDECIDVIYKYVDNGCRYFIVYFPTGAGPDDICNFWDLVVNSI
jgi:alkanesulfonate monooxygenase SsuD/methylene tetrahydromethanopterin reductase-like flavin-dependent oxidoreductase (luciferase family)